MDFGFLGISFKAVNRTGMINYVPDFPVGLGLEEHIIVSVEGCHVDRVLVQGNVGFDFLDEQVKVLALDRDYEMRHEVSIVGAKWSKSGK